ncbi:outer membrane beta-barrel protein [Brumimicrobium mesophilum]|uniref:outer membrane beta-barrel protein n=1 Tax=Brumimicrobium mesophilum TaxID=392717 RepID=UPI000D13F547|nr:outer membrane beta-barrel protein [Brumimicrobium mesophilum]
MKYFLTLLLSVISLFGTTQIITNDSSTDDKEVEIQEIPIAPKSGTELYFGVSPSYTYRTLEINDGLFAKPLGYRTEEVGEWTTGFNAGVRSKVAKHLKLEIGIGYSSNRESYDFKETDSVFSYVNTYRHISFPIRVAYTYGDEISFYGGIGVIPKAFLGMKNELTTLDINNNENTVETIERDKFNSFLLDAVATIGTQIKFSENYGIFAMVEGRRQLSNNFNSQSPYIRKAFALGFNIGLEIYF